MFPNLCEGASGPIVYPMPNGQVVGHIGPKLEDAETDARLQDLDRALLRLAAQRDALLHGNPPGAA